MNKTIFAPLLLASITTLTQCAKPDVSDEPSAAAGVPESSHAAPPTSDRAAVTKAASLRSAGAVPDGHETTGTHGDHECGTCKGGAGREEPAEESALDVGVEKAPLRGAKDAPVTIVLFSDFECPFCAKGEATLRELEAANPGKVRVAFRHRPLAFHENAKLAAKASLAAERQGRFWEYHDVLVAHPRELRRDDLERYASELGLDRARFRGDLDDPALDERIAEDTREAERLEVRGTPTAFIDGRRLTGAQPLAEWQRLVDRSQAAR